MVGTTDINRIGRVTLVSGGPGAWDLITVRGQRALAAADVILTDHLGPSGDLEQLCDLEGKEVIDVSKKPRSPSVPQSRINDLMVEHARAGRHVVRLKGGDAFVFGRGFEEVQACAAAGIPCDVVPGVTSAIAVPAAADVPVTHRGITHSFTVVSAHVPPGHPSSLVDWQALAHTGGTIVVMMGVRTAPQVVHTLIDAGLSPTTASCVIEEGTTAVQRSFSCPLEELPETMRRNQVVSPAIYVIGKVASLMA